MSNVYRPNPTSAIGNLSLCMSTHAARCSDYPPLFHPDVLGYGKDKLIKVPNVFPIDVPPDNGKGYINGFIHLQIPQVSNIMNQLIQPTDFMNEVVNKYHQELEECVAGFHIRRGASVEDAKKYALGVPFASQRAVDAMVEEANKIDKPVYVLSDSVSTKQYFKSKVPLARCLDIDIGFTADEHSQKVEVKDEDFQNKVNSMAEWFLLSRMPKVYMTAGGINGRNVDSEVEEGITSTFGYSAALYGGKIPYYVFNDGHIHYPDGKEILDKRYRWSDM